MGSVNTNPSAPLPPQAGGNGIVNGITSMGNSLGSTLTDSASFVGVENDDDGNLRAGVDPLALGGFAAATTGGTALMALRNRVDPLTGVKTSFLDSFGTQAATNSIRVTPTLVSAIAGPAIADGITMIAPNLVKKYHDTKEIKDATIKKQTEADNKSVKIQRFVAGTLAVGVAAGAVFLLKPDLFKKFGAGVTHAIEGSTQFSVGDKVTKLSGVLDATQIRNGMSVIGKPIADDAAITILKTVRPMAKDAVFSNRALVATAGGLGTLFLANKAAGEEDPGQKKIWWGAAAGAAALTAGGTYGIGKLTQRSLTANSGAGGLLAKNELLMKPNIEWVKKYFSTIAPITAVPAGSAASQYYNIVDDFEEITDSRSPFRK